MRIILPVGSFDVQGIKIPVAPSSAFPDEIYTAPAQLGGESIPKLYLRHYARILEGGTFCGMGTPSDRRHSIQEARASWILNLCAPSV